LEYVDYLTRSHWVPPGNDVALDHVRKIGNAANHELIQPTRGDAVGLLSFVEMLLKFMYEFPKRYASPKPP
jgi:hypothetical protein